MDSHLLPCLFLLAQVLLLTQAKPTSQEELKSGISHPEKVLSPIVEHIVTKESADSPRAKATGKEQDDASKEQDHDACEDVYCRLGRVCQVDNEGYSHCVCAPAGYCDGHYKDVCGTDGVLYPSHCELHRMACVKAIHIRIDHTGEACSKPAKLSAADKVLVRKERIDPITVYKPTQNQESRVADIKDEYEDDDESEEEQWEKEEKKDKTDVNEDDEDDDEEEDDDDNRFEKERRDYEDDDDEYEETYPKVTLNAAKEEVKSGHSENDTTTIYNLSNDQSKLVVNQSTNHLCTWEQYKEFKRALIRYHCARIGEVDCLHDTSRRNFVVKVMLNYYDANGDKQVSAKELDMVKLTDRLEELSLFCDLTHLINYGDDDHDGQISDDEFEDIFEDVAPSSRQLHVFHTLVTTGNSVELLCDVEVTGTLIWKRNGVKLNELEADNLKVSREGSLYIRNLALHHMGNYTCQDSTDEKIIQTHVLRIQAPPVVSVSPHSSFKQEGDSVLLHCHAVGVPQPQLSWEINEQPVPADPNQRHVVLLNNNSTLEVRNAIYSQDTGAYKCKAKNSAGTSEDVSVVYIKKEHKPQLYKKLSLSEVFVVFHDKGYSVYEPSNCLMTHQVAASYSHLQPGVYDATPQTLCEGDQQCSWGGAVNVQDRYIYVTQPRLNRVLVVEVSDRYNPVEVMPTDAMPVEVYYLQQQDQVWIVCWNLEAEDGRRTVLVVRNASSPGQHHTLHVQGLSNRFDMVENIFLPPSQPLSQKFTHAYITHNDQTDLYKLDVRTLQYTKVVHLDQQHCLPKKVAFLTIGGQILVHCRPAEDEDGKPFQLILDYITDTVISTNSFQGEPQVSPDSRYVVQMDEDGDRIVVDKVDDDGTFEHVLEDTTGVHASGSAFFHAESGKSYDLFVSSRNKNDLMYINLDSGKAEIIEGVGQAMPQKEWPWSKQNRVVVSSGYFSNYLVTPARDSVFVINGLRRHTHCEWQDITHGNVIVWVKLGPQ